MKTVALVGISALLPVLAACGSDGSGNSGASGNNPQPPATEIFAQVRCAAEGEVEGPLDPLQGALVEQLGGALADIPGLGASGESVVIGVASLLDVLDALLGSAQALGNEGDAEAGQMPLDGAADALRCTAKALFDAYALSPLADFAPREVDALVAELVALMTLLDGADSLGGGLETLTGRLASLSDALSDLANVLPKDISALDGVVTLSALTEAPAHLFANLADVLRLAGQLDGEGTGDAVATTLTDLLGLLQVVSLPDGGEGALVELLTGLQDVLSQTLGALLGPIFDLIGGIFRNDEIGFASRVYGDFLHEGLTGQPANSLAAYAGGMAPDGVERPSLRSMLATQ